MQVSHTLIAAQQAAREAQVRFQAQHVASPGFAAALDAAARPESQLAIVSICGGLRVPSPTPKASLISPVTVPTATST